MRKINSRSEDIIEEHAFLNSSAGNNPKLVQNHSDNSTVGRSTKDSLGPNTNQNPQPIPNKKKDPLSDYIELDMIGSGSYGRVAKVQRKRDGKYFAMKAVDKKKIEKVRNHKNTTLFLFISYIRIWYIDEQNLSNI